MMTPIEIQKMPKFDLHHHLDGAFFTEDLYNEAKRRNLPQGQLDYKTFVSKTQVSPQCNSLTDFLAVFDFFYEIGRDPNFQKEQARKIVHLFQKQGIIYAETRFSPHLYANEKITPQSITQAVLDGLNIGYEQTGLRVNAILCMMRGAPVAHLNEIVDFAKYYRDQGIVGIDLAGDESKYPCDELAPSFHKAASENIPVTIHAGEGSGAETVKKAVVNFSARRIGHGIRSREDKDLLDLLKEKKIALEVCLTSNLQTGTVGSWQDHPFAEYLRQGLCVTINTDDPSVSGIDINHEWQQAIKRYNLTPQEIRQLLKNSADSAFCDEDLRQKLYERITQF